MEAPSTQLHYRRKITQSQSPFLRKIESYRNGKMSHTEIAETAESEISLQSVSPDWRKRLLFSEFSVDSSEAHEPKYGSGQAGVK